MTATTTDFRPAVYQAALKEAVTLSDLLIVQVVQQARRELRRREETTADPRQRSQIKLALSQLLAQESSLCERFVSLLQRALGPVVPPEPTPGAATLRFDALELMQESQVDATVEFARAQHIASQAVQGRLAELDALICAAQGLSMVRPDSNPLRPELYVRLLRDALEKAPVHPVIRLQWMHQMGKALGPELNEMYLRLIAALKRLGVQPASFVVVPLPDAGSRRAPAARARFLDSLVSEVPQWAAIAVPAPAAPPASDSGQEKISLTVAQLRRLVSGESEAHPAGSDGPATRVVSDFSKLHTEVAPAPVRPAVSVPEAENRANQALGQQVVKLMLENIAGDVHLLPPVQEAVRALAAPLLRLAAVDPRFFSFKQHPARLMLERMTQRSLAYSSIEAAGFQSFFEPLWRCVTALQHSEVSNAQVFERALADLEAAWAEQPHAGRALDSERTAVIQTLLQAEQRHMLAEKIAREILQRPGIAEADDEIRQFLCGPWAQVMAQARLKPSGSAPDPGGYEAWVSDLLWSVTPRQTSLNRERLIRLVPKLMITLREGMKSIGFPATQSQAFVKCVLALHQLGLQSGRDSTTGPAALEAAHDTRPTPLQASPATDPAALARPATVVVSEPWLAPRELRRAGLVDAPTQTLQESQSIRTQPEPPVDTPSEATFTVGMQAFGIGAWFDFQEKDQWNRIQLTWATPHGTMFMFSSVKGSTHSVTRRMLDKLLSEGRLKWLSSGTLVSGALDAVTQVAMHNSLNEDH